MIAYKVLATLALVLALVGPGELTPNREESPLDLANQGVVCLFVCPPVNETACVLQGGQLTKPGGVCGNCPTCTLTTTESTDNLSYT